MSDWKVIKSVSKWRYEVSLYIDNKNIFHVVSDNFMITNPKTMSFSDYNMASWQFDEQINAYEGV